MRVRKFVDVFQNVYVPVHEHRTGLLENHVDFFQSEKRFGFAVVLGFFPVSLYGLLSVRFFAVRVLVCFRGIDVFCGLFVGNGRFVGSVLRTEFRNDFRRVFGRRRLLFDRGVAFFGKNVRDKKEAIKERDMIRDTRRQLREINSY